MNKQISDILKSKRFWSAVIGLLAVIITSLSPELEPHIEEILPSVVVIVGLLIGGYTMQDTAREWKQPGVDQTPPDDTKELPAV